MGFLKLGVTCFGMHVTVPRVPHESRLLNSCRPLKNKAPPVIEVLGWNIHGLLVMGSWFWGFGFLNKDCAARGLMHHSLPSNLWSIERDHANSVHGMVWYGMVVCMHVAVIM